MAKFAFTHPDDNIISTATITDGLGSIDAAWPIVNLYDGNPALPLRAVSANLDLRFQFPSPVALAMVAAIHHNIYGGTCVIQAHTSNSWGGPAFSAALTLPTGFDAAGYMPGLWLDLTALNATAYTWWRFAVTSNAANVVLGELVLSSAYRRPAHNVNWGLRVPEGPTTVRHRTPSRAVMAYQKAPSTWGLQAKVETSDAGYATLLNWRLAASGARRSFVFILDPAATTPDAKLTRFADDKLVPTLSFTNYNEFDGFEIEEVARGESWQ